MKKILCVIGTRPQVIKHIPFQKIMSESYKLVNLHTGQHYDPEMKDAFISEIELDIELELKSTSRESRMLEMTDNILTCIDKNEPDMVVVYGDTDTTLAAAYATTNKKLPLCHIEAGLRSHNLEMPEEVNRIETDNLSHLLLCPSQEAVDQLKKEGITEGVYLVGDIMKDAVRSSTELVVRIPKSNYYYATMHRPYNVDDRDRLRYVLTELNSLEKVVVMPLHPRTKKCMETFNIKENEFSNIHFIAPQTYLSNLSYMTHSEAVLTDSGGMQKEAYWINKKCITIRKETEWTETIHDGCNILIFDDLSGLQTELKESSGPWNPNLYGNGHSMDKIKNVIDNYFERA